jgi:hypothetical protein
MGIHRNIRECVATKIAPQNSQVIGRDRLAFFEAKELFTVAPFPVKIHGGIASLAIGRVHSVKKGAEFIARQPTTDIVLSVDQDGRIIEYTFKNKDEEELCLTVINLTPGFRVRQLFPSEDLAQPTPAGATCSFRLRVTLPEKLRGGTKQRETVHRDIWRTIATKGERLSFKSLELPNVWDAGLMRCGERGKASRHAF